MYDEYMTKALVGIINAKQALDNYQKLHIRDLKNTAAYNIQQAMEYLFKYSIYNCMQYNNGETDSDNIKQIYKHDLDALYKLYCKPYNIYVPEPIKKNAKSYSLWEAESRYSLNFQVHVNSIAAAIKYTEQWLITLKPSYTTHIERVNNKLNWSKPPGK